MTHVIAFSGGKDSTALVLWARENLPTFTTVFCDTGWEHQFTYDYIQKINNDLLSGTLITLRSNKFENGMRDLVVKKKRVPSAKARFCTEELKVIPMKEYLDTIDDDLTVYQGIRSQESFSRSKMEKRVYDDYYDAWVERPLFDWSDTQVFDYLKLHNVEPNPLYLLGAGRVGCFPCVLINHRELKSYLKVLPEIRERIIELETLVGRSFFPPNYIPTNRHTGRDTKSGKSFCWATDVFKYIEDDPDQIDLLPIVNNSCMSIYNLCE